jgi:hypothetical protein
MAMALVRTPYGEIAVSSLGPGMIGDHRLASRSVMATDIRRIRVNNVVGAVRFAERRSPTTRQLQHRWRTSILVAEAALSMEHPGKLC